jgi:NTP pyrophosphatase (non-canonical NTP hydrolase)
MPSNDELSAKLREECEELIEAIANDYGASIIDEAADVIAVVTGICSAKGYSLRDLEHAMRRNVIKNGNKNPDTHKRIGETIVLKDQSHEKN